VTIVVSAMGEYPSILSDSYHLLRVIGSGGMGVVWRAYDQTLNRQVACKVLSGSFSHDLVFQQRFQREGHHIASLSHPNIVMVFDSGTEGVHSFIVMEYVQGASLRQVLGFNGLLSIGATAALAGDVLAALGHAHERGIVHRDVKPANLLLQSGGGVKVADFGIAKSLGEVTDLTAEGGFVGTSAYASPEQLSGQPVGPSSDLYSLGCVLFECLTGQPPSRSTDSLGRAAGEGRFAELPTAREWRRDLPEEVARGIARALAKDPSDRFSSAAEMLDVFHLYAQEDQLHTLLADSDLVDDLDQTETSGSEGTPVQPSDRRRRQSFPTEDAHRDSLTSTKPKWRRKTIYPIAIATLILIAAVAAVFIATRGTKKTPVERSSTLSSGGFLQPGHSIVSRNDRFTLRMQTDGNLVDYTRPEKIALWQSGTSGNFNAYVVMQADGNLVVYPHGRTAPAAGQPTSAIFQSGTSGHPGASAALLNNGDLVVRASSTHAVLWRAPLRVPA
jgi:serine/threonine protein kinase